MKKAKDIMIPLYNYLKQDNTLKEAANLLRTAKRSDNRVGVKGLPVLDENGKLIGMLSMRDILRAVYPEYMYLMNLGEFTWDGPEYMYLMNLGEFTWDGMLEDMAKKAAGYKVKDYMSKDVITVKENCPLMECVDRLVKNKVQRLPVIDNAGNVVGMLYHRDIFFAIAGSMLDENHKEVSE